MNAYFSIILHIKDKSLIYKIRDTFGVGTVHLYEKISKVVYTVTSMEALTNVIIPHFNAYPLNSQKRADFELFKMAIDLINRKEHLTMEGLNKIVCIRAAMNKGLTEELKTAFPYSIAIVRPAVQTPIKID